MAFGHLDADRTSFLLAFTVATGPKGEHPAVTRSEPALRDQGMWFHEAQAFSTVKAVFKASAGGSYNLAVLPANDQRWFVYAYPAQVTNDIFPTGADVRYLLSADGTKIEDTHPMHFSRLDFKVDPAQKEVSTFRTAVLDDAPEDTDVADVLMMGGVPTIVATRKFVYQVAADGAITYLSTTPAFLKDVKK